MAVVEAIATTYLENSDVATVTFSSIPQTYEHLEIHHHGRMDATSGAGHFKLQVGNGSVDTGSNYTLASMGAGTSSLLFDYGGSEAYYSLKQQMPGDRYSTSIPGEYYGTTICTIMDYRNTNKARSIVVKGGYVNIQYPAVLIGGGTWMNTADAIDIITMTCGVDNYDRGTVITLYGWNSA